MSEIPRVLVNAAAWSGCVGLLYTGVLLVIALVSVLARTPQRRRDARSTLGILVRRRAR